MPVFCSKSEVWGLGGLPENGTKEASVYLLLMLVCGEVDHSLLAWAWSIFFPNGLEFVRICVWGRNRFAWGEEWHRSLPCRGMGDCMTASSGDGMSSLLVHPESQQVQGHAA